MIPRRAYLAAGVFLMFMTVLMYTTWYHIQIEPVGLLARGESYPGELAENVEMLGLYIQMVITPLGALKCLWEGVRYE